MKRLAEQRFRPSPLAQLQLDGSQETTMSYYLSIKKVNFKYIRVAISISNNSISIHSSTSTSTSTSNKN